jgi:hypothetical protein
LLRDGGRRFGVGQLVVSFVVEVGVAALVPPVVGIVPERASRGRRPRRQTRRRRYFPYATEQGSRDAADGVGNGGADGLRDGLTQTLAEVGQRAAEAIQALGEGTAERGAERANEGHGEVLLSLWRLLSRAGGIDAEAGDEQGCGELLGLLPCRIVAATLSTLGPFGEQLGEQVQQAASGHRAEHPPELLLGLSFGHGRVSFG